MPSPASTYEDQAVAAIRQAGASRLAPELSPIVSLGVSLYDVALDVAEGLSEADPAKVAFAVGSALLEAAASLLEISEVVPIVGQVLGFVGFALDAPPAAATAQEVADVRRKDCLSWYVPVASTAAGGPPTPADFFVATDPTTGELSAANASFRNESHTYRGKATFRTSAGEALRVILETNGELPIALVREKLGGATGIPAETQLLCRSLRGAVTSGFRVADGGQAPWRVLLDAARAEREAKHLDSRYAFYLVACEQARLAYNPGDPRVQQAAVAALAGAPDLLPPEVCLRWDRRGLDQALSLVTSWTNVVRPTYDTDRAALAAAEESAVEELFQQTEDAPRNRLLLLGLALAAERRRHRPRLKFSPGLLGGR